MAFRWYTHVEIRIRFKVFLICFFFQALRNYSRKSCITLKKLFYTVSACLLCIPVILTNMTVLLDSLRASEVFNLYIVTYFKLNEKIKGKFNIVL